MATRVKLLGPPAVEYQGAWTEPPPGRISALLYHLACRGGWVSRNDLAFLFWPDSPENRARSNLRKTLNRARELPFAQGLEAERTRLRWQVETDLQAFRLALEEGRYRMALQHYGGELLQGFRLDDVGEFERWLEGEREDVGRAWRRAVLAHVDELEAAGRAAEAAEALDPLCRADPFDEEILRRLLADLAASGQQVPALDRFERFEKQLRSEFTAEPEAATVELIGAIRRQREEPGLLPARPPAAAPAAKPRHDLPAQLTAFVGRAAELARIAAQLADPACRLLTLVAPGGMGKTRLALAAAATQQDRFADGVVFVPFAAVAAPDQMAGAIAEALGLPLAGRRRPEEELVAHLGGREMLLLLDNLEHLLGGVGLIGELLENAPGLKILATSRERLQLRAEWLFELRGLAFPAESGEQEGGYDAIGLFLQSARRVLPGFAIDERNRRSVARVCRLVAGMPLAIELAVSWLRVLDVDEVADEIERGIDVLEASFQDLPERQKSIRAVFDHSWQLLSAEQRKTLAALAVFRGGFDRTAAQTVAGVSTRGLLELLVKSLLHRHETGRFDFHPLVLEYAREKLAAMPAWEAEVEDRHGAFYLDFLLSWGNDLKGGRQKEALAAIGTELGNLRGAWQWALRHRDASELAEACVLVERLFTQRNDFRGGMEMLEQVVTGLDESLPGNRTAIARALVSQAWLSFRLSLYDQGRRLAQRALTLFSPEEASDGFMEAFNALGAIAGQSGRYREAQQHFEQALALARQRDRRGHMGYYFNNLAIVAKELGDYDLAERYYHEALALNRQRDDRITVIRNLGNLGSLLLIVGRTEEAEVYLLEGLALARDIGARQPLTTILLNLGGMEQRRGNVERSLELYQEALREAQESGARNERATALRGLAGIDMDRGAYQQAENRLLRALSEVREIENRKAMLATLLPLAGLWRRQGRARQAVAALELVVRHEAADRPTQDDARALLEELRGDADGEALGPPPEAGVDLEELVAAVLQEGRAAGWT